MYVLSMKRNRVYLCTLFRETLTAHTRFSLSRFAYTHAFHSLNLHINLRKIGFTKQIRSMNLPRFLQQICAKSSSLLFRSSLRFSFIDLEILNLLYEHRCNIDFKSINEEQSSTMQIYFRVKYSIKPRPLAHRLHNDFLLLIQSYSSSIP